jgi:serine protease Do
MDDELNPKTESQSSSVAQPKATLASGNSRSNLSKNTAIMLTLFISLIVGFFGGWLGARVNQSSRNSGGTEQAKRIVENESQLISNIAKDLSPSVVSVNVTSQTPQQDFFGNVRSFEQQSAGTGFIISDKGDILTNRHVVPKGATTVSVTLSDGTQLDNVEVVGRTNDSDPLDVAFLRVKDAKGKKLQPVKIGDSNKMEVGYMVVAIGNALGQFQNTVTSGIISGYGRSVQAQGDGDQLENLQNLFQTDAAINQGNSGGPLVNANGQVIGINTAVAGDGAENIGFAIPINDVQGLIKSVLEKNKLERPFLGVRYVPLTDDYAYQYNLNTKRGAYLAPGTEGQSPVIPDSPAAKAGLKEKDIIIKVNDQPIDEKNSLTSVLGRYSVGETIKLTVVRDGKEQIIDVTLGTAPQS